MFQACVRIGDENTLLKVSKWPVAKLSLKATSSLIYPVTLTE